MRTVNLEMYSSGFCFTHISSKRSWRSVIILIVDHYFKNRFNFCSALLGTGRPPLFIAYQVLCFLVCLVHLRMFCVSVCVLIYYCIYVLYFYIFLISFVRRHFTKFLAEFVCVCVCVCAVSYTHLSLEIFILFI